jgi:hypothetical protein
LSSFDAFIFDGQRLVLLQATIAKPRRITQQGIRKLLAMLAQEPARIPIVFVVPNAARGISVTKHYLQEGWRVGTMPVLVGYAVLEVLGNVHLDLVSGSVFLRNATHRRKAEY